MFGTAALLALADQRLPVGGHAHSGGVEQAVTDRLVYDVRTLAVFLRRRLVTTGRVSAAAAAAAAITQHKDQVNQLDAELEARTLSPAQREASRAQGRGLLRLATVAWAAPHPDLSWADLGPRPHHAIVLGCACRAAGIDPLITGAATIAAYLSITGPATAAQRLLGLDPVQVAAATLALGEEIDAIARQVTGELPHDPAHWRHLADDGDPLLDLLAERHAVRGDRLFAS